MINAGNKEYSLSKSDMRIILFALTFLKSNLDEEITKISEDAILILENKLTKGG